jgi:threonine dehydratase
VFDPLEIWHARARLRGHVRYTPLMHSHGLSRRLACDVYLKMECWQVCGCFKVRGACNAVLALSPDERARGLVTASSGNHAIGLAYAARQAGGAHALAFVPRHADPMRVNRIRELGAEVRFDGDSYQDAFDAASVHAAETGAVYIHSHNAAAIVAGQGTIGLELLDDLPAADAVIVPIGGGGLVAGITAAVRAAGSTMRIIGAEPSAAPGAYLSLRDGYAHERIETRSSIADGLLGGFGRLPFEITQGAPAGAGGVERVALVEDAALVDALRLFQAEEQLMLEPAAAAGLAALLSGDLDLKGAAVVLVLTSRNVSAERYNQILVRQ